MEGMRKGDALMCMRARACVRACALFEKVREEGVSIQATPVVQSMHAHTHTHAHTHAAHTLLMERPMPPCMHRILPSMDAASGR